MGGAGRGPHRDFTKGAYARAGGRQGGIGKGAYMLTRGQCATARATCRGRGRSRASRCRSNRSRATAG
eukprot:3133913-Prymnesium_polylepis.1